jgi:Ser-tRNA(Ala) deacylase AlaX
MKKHTQAVQFLKAQLKETIVQKRTMQEEIRKLKAEGPSTGPARHTLRWNYNWTWRWRARAYHVAECILRGVPYAAIERNACEPPVWGVHKVLQEAFKDDDAQRAEWTLDRVKELLTVPEPAPQVAVQTQEASHG